MYPNLGPAHLGITTDLAGSIALAKRHGFAGVEFSLAETATLVAQHGPEHVRAMFEDAEIRPGHFGLELDLRGEEASYQKGLSTLRRHIVIAPRIGCHRTAVAISPVSDTLPYEQNFSWWVKRLGPVAQILADQDCRLGLEFIGPKTKRIGAKYEFAHTQSQMLELAHAVGHNIGLLHDSWHWYTSGGTLRDVHRLHAQDIVVVHVNEAPTGIDPDAQIDNQREMPMATGVIDLGGYIRMLDHIGYDGPVTVEPFSARVRALDPHEACAEAAASLQKAFSAAGVIPT